MWVQVKYNPKNTVCEDESYTVFVGLEDNQQIELCSEWTWKNAYVSAAKILRETADRCEQMAKMH